MIRLIFPILLSLAGSLRGDGAEPFVSPSPDTRGFERVVAPFFNQYCLDCHSGTAAEAELALEQVDEDLIRGNNLETWRMIAEQIRFGDMPPDDANQPTADQRKSVLDWIRQELLKTQWPGVVSDEKLSLPQFGNYVDHEFLFGEKLPRVYPAPPRLWRLRPEIYDRAMPRLAEKVDGLANGLNVADGSEFKDYSAPYFLDEASATPLLGNAKKIAAKMVGEQSKDRIFKELIDESSPLTPETVAASIETAFRKALGRKPSDEETVRFQTFFKAINDDAGREVAGKALLTAVLLQPEVFYRQELGDGHPDEFGRVRLTQQEIAYALSYAFADEPLDEFTSAADEGKLAMSPQVAELVHKRLHDDSKLYDKNPRIMQFLREYFHYPFAIEVFKDDPPGSTHSPHLLINDLETNIRDLLREDRDVLKRLLTDRKYYVNAIYKENKDRQVVLQIADARQQDYPTVYGMPLDWKWSLDLQPIRFRSEERAGVLTHPAWLAAWSGNFDNHPVQRGKWIRTHLLGGTVPDVPIGVDARVPELEHTTFRERLRLATAAAECWRCHKKMDPLGVTFERYDHYGRYQRLDNGQPVDASGEITRTGVSQLDGRKVNGPAELMDILANSEFVEQVFIRHLFRYLLGRNETLGDANTLQNAHRAYRDNGGSLNAAIASILSSDSFLYRLAVNPAPVVTKE